MGNLLSLNPKIHSLRTDAKIFGCLSDVYWMFVVGFRNLSVTFNKGNLSHGTSL
jgi:hypothetical protein